MKAIKKIVILGSTGSVGTTAVQVAKHLKDQVEVVGLAAGSNAVELAKQARELKVKHVAIKNIEARESLRQQLGEQVNLYVGKEGLVELASLEEVDLVLVAITGIAGLFPALVALERGKSLAVASKEILVMAGQILMPLAKEKGAKILPVDSEHSALLQCLQSSLNPSKEVSKLILTASGGPFRLYDHKQLSQVTKKQALCHPTWKMGEKITIDSATLFNKGLEMIEAVHLFGVDESRIEIVIHPQSRVHSMVEFIDGQLIAHLSRADMSYPIQHALTWPNRVSGGVNKGCNLIECADLQFNAYQSNLFPAIDLAREAVRAGGDMPAVMNAANEIAVEAFLNDQISFLQISQLVDWVMQKHCVNVENKLATILNSDKEARQKAKERIRSWLK